MTNIKVLLVEDNCMLRDGIINILKRQKDIDLHITSSDSENAQLVTQKLRPDIILVDSAPQNQKCMQAIETAKKNIPRLKVIVINLPPAQTEILQYIVMGSDGFILDNATCAELMNTIKEVADGLTVLPAKLVSPLFSQIVQFSAQDAKSKMSKDVWMTKREREVIELLSRGLSNKEISRKINLSTYTVKSHIHNIMEKLGFHTRLEIANYSYSAFNLQSFSKNDSIFIN